MNIKLLLFSSLFLLFSFAIRAQQNTFKEVKDVSYSIQNISLIENSETYISAINNADFNNHRLKSKRNTIIFEGGLSVILYSAEELVQNGITTINPQDFLVDFENYIAPMFKLSSNNHIIESKRTIIPKQ